MWRFHARRRRRNTGRFSVRRMRLPPQLPPPGDGCSKNLRRRYYSFIRLRSHRHNKPVATSTRAGYLDRDRIKNRKPDRITRTETGPGPDSKQSNPIFGLRF
ncbi:unnamed protein product [Linum tenue]|uniref:Uncharacterized protein n=1 Tax=Linum tenue TaxID=586396 RepID=A0AAV0S258_9ROSI|nr:unnamed protein product [Linum tenue]